MPAPYSIDLRERVVQAYLSGQGTYVEVASQFDVGEATVDRWVSRHRNRGTVAPDPMGGDRNGKFDEAAEGRLVEMVAADPDATRRELVWRIQDHLGLEVSSAAVQRALDRLQLTRKKRRSMPPNGTLTA